MIAELQTRLASTASSGASGATAEALDRLQEQYDMVLQDAKRMTAEVEGYDSTLR